MIKPNNFGENFELSVQPQKSLSELGSRNLSYRRTTFFGRQKTVTPASWKSELLSTLWGFDENADGSSTRWLNRIERLGAYFRDFEGFLPHSDDYDCGTSSDWKDCEGAERNAHARFLRYIQLLKLNPETARHELKNGILGNICRDEAGQTAQGGHMITAADEWKFPGNSRNDGEPCLSDTSKIVWPIGSEPSQFLSPSLSQKDTVALFNTSLAAATRALFGISIHDEPCFSRGEKQIKQSKCLWKESMNLKDLLDREFPTSHRGDHLSGRFKERLVSLRNLVKHADIKVVWTKHLPDHLLLSYSEHNKTLSIFDLPSLIEVSYEACERVEERDSNINKLSYCHNSLGGLMFSSEFMLETLQTYRLLVPYRDIKWARRKFLSTPNNARMNWFTPWISAHQQASDPRLTEIFSFWHHEADVGSRLTTYSQMFKRYPHWGLRIQSLMEEAEDPTPMTWTGRWAERRKGPRHAFWVTIIAFVVASLFGTVAMVLGIAQFWVAWCDWNGGKAALCNPRGATVPDGSQPTDVSKVT